MNFNVITFIVLTFFWPIWLVWELVVLSARTKTISMVARDMGPRLSSMVFLWAGLAAHFWWTAEAYAGVVGTVAFWGIAAVLLTWDIILHIQGRILAAWYRKPWLWLAVGTIAGRFLFPQAHA